MDPVSIAIVSAGALVAAGGALYWNTRPSRTDGRFPAPHGGPIPVPADTIERVIALRTLKSLNGAPASIHEVPILGRVSTPWVEGFSPRDSISLSHPQEGITTLAAVREMLNEAGAGDVDPRCYWRLIGNECGPTGVHCWYKAIGNMKANWGIYGTADRMRAGFVSVAAPECSCVWAVVDSYQSHDVYYGYDTFRNAVTHHMRLFQNPRYAGVRSGYAAGGLAGLIQAERALANGGYSPETADTREAEATRFWNARARQCGDGWVR